jgi:hypothetical protein
MKKVFAMTASIILFIVAANAQSEKKEPPPPPPKPKEEKIKSTPPKIVRDEEIQKKAPPPPPPMVEMVKFTPPKIVKDEEVGSKKDPVVTVKGEMADDFYKRNPTVKTIFRQGNTITLKMKDGTAQKFNMSKQEEDKKFTEKYGACPIPPPPKSN